MRSASSGFQPSGPPIGPDAGFLFEEGLGQINVPPARPGGLWKVVAAAIRCPACDATNSKACTGKRPNGDGLTEHYRLCRECGLRFRVVLE